MEETTRRTIKHRPDLQEHDEARVNVLSVRISNEMLEQLREGAHLEKKQTSTYIRRLLQTGLDHWNAQERPRVLKELMSRNGSARGKR